MARVCSICKTGKLLSRKVSHSNIKTKIYKRPNLQRVRSQAAGTSARVLVCTRCLRSGCIEKRARPAKEE